MRAVPFLAIALALVPGAALAQEPATKSGVEPPSIEFSEQSVGRASAPRVVTYTAGTDTKSKSLRLKTIGDFAVSPDHCEPLDAKTPCSVTVTFSPKQAGKTTGEMAVVDGDIAWPRVRLSGTGACASDCLGIGGWWLVAAAVLYMIGFILARWHLIALPTRNLLLAQLDGVKARIESLPSAGIPSALKNLLEKAYEIARKDSSTQFLFWSRGNEIAAWDYVHKVEEMLVHYLPQSQVRVGMEETAAELRQIDTEPAPTLAAKIEAELADTVALSGEQRALLMDAETFLRSIQAQLALDIDAALAASEPDARKIRQLLEAIVAQLRARAKVVAALIAALPVQSPPMGTGLKLLQDDLLRELDPSTAEHLKAFDASPITSNTLPDELVRRLKEARAWVSSPMPALASRIAQALGANYAAPIERWRALLSESLGLVYDRKDTRFATLMTWHNKTAWMLSCAMLLIVAIGVTLDNAVLLLVGAAGGLLSRLSRTVYAADVPTDYGASWTTLFLSPVIGAISAWGGILLIALGVKLNVIGAAIDISWCGGCNACNPIVLALAMGLGFTERWFDQILKPLQDKILAQQSAAPAAVLKITSAPQLPAATKDVSYSTKLTASGGAPEYKWSTVGQWPSDLKLDAKTGEIGGKFAIATKEPFTFDVKVTDSKGAVATQTLKLEVK